MWMRLPCRNWLVMSVAVSIETIWPDPRAATSSSGTTPQRVKNASSAWSPPCVMRSSWYP